MVVPWVRASFAGLVLLVAACGSGGGFPDARSLDMPIPGGHFAVAWTLADLNSQPITCDQIGAQGFTASIHNHAVEGGETEVFSCSTGSGQSQGFLPGVYDMDFEIGNGFGTIATAPPQLGVVLRSGETTQLAPIAFSVDAKGNLALHIASNKPAGNCAATASNGAGITTTSITLVRNSDNSCAPLTLDIAAGATQPASTYTINCTTPVDAPCIESDQAITASGVASDAYTIHVRGKNAVGTVCWGNNDGLQVPTALPPMFATLTRTLNLAFATGTPGC